MRLKTTIVLLSTVVLITNACKKKGCMDEKATNYSQEAKKDDGSCKYDTLLLVPTTYVFTRNGNNTVSFTGQTTRMDMLSEMTTLMKTANIAGVSVSQTDLLNMYTNNGYTWVDVNNLGLNNTTKQLKNKTAFANANGTADAGIQAMFESYMISLANISSITTTGAENGTAGTAGVWPNDGVKGPYLMDADGKEYTQLIEKGLMCVVFMSQITVNYLEKVKNSENTTLVSGEYYTEMEHFWDEGYGYFTEAIDYPTSGTDRFWGKYANNIEPIIQSASKISLAFRTGRTAIVNKDYSLRDMQVTIIRDELEKVSAATAIHYLNVAKTNITNNTTRNHALSEAYAFLDGLKYGYNAINAKGMTYSEINTALGYFENDFNIVTLTDLDNAIDLIASKTGLTNVKNDL